MKQPAPYRFPLKSRAAIVDYLTRDGRSYHYRRYRFAWNVKTHGARFDGATLRKINPGLSPDLDSAWDSYVEKTEGLFWIWCEDAARGICDGEWTSYPGDDQGDWDLSFAGRSGGWIVLEKWRGRSMVDFDPADFAEWSWPDLVAFYRGIVCADSDFTPAKAAAEVQYFAACDREQWEEEKRAERNAQAERMAESIMAARPDLAPVWESRP